MEVTTRLLPWTVSLNNRITCRPKPLPSTNPLIDILTTMIMANTKQTSIRSKITSHLSWITSSSVGKNWGKTLWRGRSWLKMWWVAKNNWRELVIGVTMWQRIGRKESRQRAATWKKFPRAILTIIPLSTKLKPNNFLAIKKKSANQSEDKKSHTATKARPWPFNDRVGISRLPLLLLLQHLSPGEWMRQLLTQKLPKFWRSILQALLKAEMRKPPLRLFASPRVDSSAIHPHIKLVTALAGEGKSSTKTMGCLKGVVVASWETTATKKMWWGRPKRRQQRKSRKSSERPVWKSSRRKVGVRIWSGTVWWSTASIFDQLW